MEDSFGGGSGAFMLKQLLKSRTIHLSEAVTEDSSERIINQLLLLEADDPEAYVTFIVNSPGGSVTAGFAIYDTIKFISCPVRIVCAGLAASIATIILLGPEKKDRLALPNTKLLIHQPLIPSTVIGPASDLEITAKEIIKTREKINQLLSAETGQPLDRVSRDTQRDYWLTAEEAIEYGLIHAIVTSRADLG